LAGTSVTINGFPAPLAFVSPTQINAQVPSSLYAGTSSEFTTASLVVTTSAGSSAPAVAALAIGAPGFFTAEGSGCGQTAALNVKSDGTLSANSSSNSVAPGDYVALFGTGFGLALEQPPDGAATDGGLQFAAFPEVLVDGNPLPALPYWGLAPTLAGVDQINLQVPASTRNGCSTPVSASQTLGSPSVTISVQSGGGQCIDPPIQSYGQLSLDKSTFYGPVPNSVPIVSEGFTASFPSGPDVQPPAPEAVVYAPVWMSGAAELPGVIVSSVPIIFRACPVPGYSDLSAGPIQIQPLLGSAVTTQPQPAASGVVYGAVLPTGFIAPGTYAISGTPGSAVALNASLVVGSPIQVQASFAPGTVISSSQPLTVQWTGGEPGTLVKVSLYSVGPNYTYSYADTGSGSLTIPPLCTGHSVSSGGNGVVCSFGLPLSSNAQITVQVMPNPASVATVALPGITGPVQLAWQYTYSFSGVVLGP
jgi:uncharacterized protein (TIGR03437 family)